MGQYDIIEEERATKWSGQDLAGKKMNNKLVLWALSGWGGGGEGY
jgi:hypothetical protein